jgi:hypothetical protein
MKLKFHIYKYAFVLAVTCILFSCGKKDDDHRPIPKIPPYTHLTVRIHFDSLQDRLDNYGNISAVPVGHGAQSPAFNSVSIGFIELLTDSTIPYQEGINIYNGTLAINASDTGYTCCTNLLEDGSEFQTNIDSPYIPGTFKYVRIYFVYENYNVSYFSNGAIYQGAVAAFLSPKTLAYYYRIGDSTITGATVKLNGEWMLEVDTPGYGTILQDRAAATQPNVLYNSLVPPSGGCIVTCRIDPELTLGDLDSRTITLSISSNKCFEWTEHSDPNYFEPFNGDTIVDVGIRGVKVIQ